MADTDSEAFAQFVSVTGANSEAASFFLDSAKGDVQTAIDQYFTSGGDMGIPQDMPGAAAAPRAQQTPGPAAQPQPAASGSAVGRSRGAGGRGKQPATGGIRSLADLGGDESSDDDENNEYYAGGEKSGQVVKAGPKDRDHKKRVEGLFDAAREHGAEDGTSADLADPAQAGPAAFSGRSRTLADGEAPAQAAPRVAAQQPQTTTHTITFFANGIFTVDNGEGRSVLDPANAEFVESIRSGTCPRELDPLDPSKHVTVNLVRNATDYVKPKYVAFGGQGQTLAGPSSSSSQPSTAGSQISYDTQWEGVDESKPTTSLQLRLADGSRMVARFNHSQTVAHIRRFIAASRPDSARAYQLMTAFPQKQLTDDSATLEAAGLLGAVIIQR